MRRDASKKYSVFADNIGNVLNTDIKKEAISTAVEYYNNAKNGIGRGDPHTFVIDNGSGDIIAEYGENESDS